MYRLLLILLLAGLLTAFGGCRTCKCIDSDVPFNFAGFQLADLKEIEIKKFNRGTGFSSTTDSTVFRDEQDYRLQQAGDSIYFTSRMSDLSVSKEWDWQIELPAAGRIFRITEIDMAQVRDDCPGKTICINPVRSMRIDGVMLQSPIIIPNGFMLHK